MILKKLIIFLDDLIMIENFTKNRKILKLKFIIFVKQNTLIYSYKVKIIFLNTKNVVTIVAKVFHQNLICIKQKNV